MAQGFAGIVNDPKAILAEILSWTGGQPFLTQKLCQLVVRDLENEGVATVIDRAREVEQIVRQQIVENWQTQDKPEHLQTIRDRLLYDKERAGRLLGLYQEILARGCAKLEESGDRDGTRIELLLSGLVVQEGDNLQVRNRIYQSVFDAQWVERQLVNLRPEAERVGEADAQLSPEQRFIRLPRRLFEVIFWGLVAILGLGAIAFLKQ